MAHPHTNITTRLREAIVSWNSHLKGITDPDDVFHQDCALIGDASEKRIQDFYLNHARGEDDDGSHDQDNDNNNIRLLLQALLSDSERMKELEREHEATRTKKQELQDEVAKTVAQRIIADVVDILGLSIVQRLVPTLLASPEETGSTTKDRAVSTSLPAPNDSATSSATTKLVPQSRSYNTRSSGGSRQRVAPSTGSTTSGGDSPLKRKRAVEQDDEPHIKQEKKSPRVSTRQATSTAGKPSSDSVRSLPVPNTRTGNLLRPSDEKDAGSGGGWTKAQYKNIRLDVTRRSARVMLQRHPFRNDLWVCLVLVPPCHANLSLDTIVSRSIMPAFVQLVNRGRRMNRPEERPMLETVPSTRNSYRNQGGEEEGELEKKFEDKEAQ